MVGAETQSRWLRREVIMLASTAPKASTMAITAAIHCARSGVRACASIGPTIFNVAKSIIDCIPTSYPCGVAE